MASLRNQQRKQSSIQRDNIQIDKPVLIVEDSAPLAQMLSALLIDQWSCEAHIAKSFAEAKSYLNKYRYNYHLAICDLVLPDAPNSEIVELLNKAKVQMIAISGNYKPSFVKDIVARGAVDFIDKNNINAYQYTTELVGRLFKNHQVKILVVDDSHSASQVVSHMLKIQNFQVLVAENGIQALKILEQNNDIKIILTDYEMPKMNGVELTVKVRETYLKESLSIIGVSGLDADNLSTHFIKNGANDFLVKPFYDELLCRINQNLDMLEYMEYISNLANRDYMTKSYNRHYFFTEGEELYQSAKNNNTDLTVCMMDIDHFKQVNDTYEDNIDCMLKVADTNLYQAKESGRNKVVG
jgi:PleD family two-component response regulator